MAYPGMVNDGTVSSKTANLQYSPQGFGGVIQYAADAWFVFLADVYSDADLNVYKSHDQGQTWTIVATEVGAFLNNMNFAYTRDAGKVWVFLLNPDAAGFGASPTMRILGFDLATETFTDDSTRSSVLSECFGDGPFVTAVTRGAGDMVVFFTGPFQELPPASFDFYSRTYYATWDGTIYGTETLVDDQAGVSRNFVPSTAVVDPASSRIHLFLANKDNNVNGNVKISHISMNADNTFNTFQDITSDNVFPENFETFGYESTGRALVADGKVALLVDVRVTGSAFYNYQEKLHIVYASLSADPSWSSAPAIVTGWSPLSSNTDFTGSHAYDLTFTQSKWVATCLMRSADERHSVAMFATADTPGGTWSPPAAVLPLQDNPFTLDFVFAQDLGDGNVGLLGGGSVDDSTWYERTVFTALNPVPAAGPATKRRVAY